MIFFEQKKFFPEEDALLKNQEELSKTSNLRNLPPFYSAEFDVLRVGGRMGNSNFNEIENFPLLIPNGSPLVPLIVRHFTFPRKNSSWWTLLSITAVNREIPNCIKRFRYSLKPPFEQMTDPPAERVTQARLFSQCGLKFPGPKITKLLDSACQKRYFHLLMCSITKAIHFDLVSNLTKEACINALKRFSERYSGQGF